MSRLHGSRVESATRPPPRFRSCSIDITAYRRAVTEQPNTLTEAEAEDDRALSATLKTHRCARWPIGERARAHHTCCSRDRNYADAGWALTVRTDENRAKPRCRTAKIQSY